MGSSGARSASITKARGTITTGDFTSTNVGATWTQVTGLTASISAAVGDYVMFIPSMMVDPTGATFLDVAVKVGASFVRYASSGTGTPATEGDPSLYGDNTYLGGGNGCFDFVVESGDLSGGTLTFAIVYRGTGTTTIVYASANYPFRWRAINYGQV